MVQHHYYKHKLDNGLEVILSPNKYLHSTSIDIGFNYGFFNEKNRMSGVSHLMEHMIFEGTGKISKENLRNLLANETVYWNGETDAEMTSYQFKLFNLSKGKMMFDGLAEMLFNSTFEEQNLKKEKTAVINEVHSNFGSDLALEGAVARAYLFKKPATTFFGGNPLIIENIPRDVVFDSYSKYYSPGNAVIAIAGNFNKEKAIDGITNAFKNIAKDTTTPNLEVYTGKTKYKDIHMKSFNPYKGQSSIIFGMKLPGADQLYRKGEEGRASISYIRNLLTERLTYRMRDEAGLAYMANSDAAIGKHTGYIVAYARVKNKSVEDGKKIMFGEIEKIINGEVDGESISRSRLTTKLIISDVFDSTLEHSTAILSSALKYGRSPLELYNEFASLNLDDVRSAAADYLKTDGQEDSVLIISN
ncbi:MAG: insulinase family protein [Candidatus Parvarchaeota archaeon]|jgi:predicted Zn-dependent peptidase|nr:insulinase family protein [Candidatus Parvarchaeota archaeon]MCL5106865.1 insulinase family protein [Candidatus Parvarchaeota archaeon]